MIGGFRKNWSWKLRMNELVELVKEQGEDLERMLDKLIELKKILNEKKSNEKSVKLAL